MSYDDGMDLYAEFAAVIDALTAALAPRGNTLDAGRIPFDVGTPRAREFHRVSRIEGTDVFSLDLLVTPDALAAGADRGGGR